MKKIFYILFGIMLTAPLYSQSYFVRFGKNTANFKFTTNNTVSKLNSEIGDSYEIGHTFPIGSNRNVDYEAALTLNKFNPFVGAPESELNYSLHYVGIDNALLYSVIGDMGRDCDFVIRVKAGISCNKLISGFESINGKKYDIKNFPEFNGILFMGILGLQSKWIVSDVVDLSIGYNRGISLLNTGQISNQSLSISTNQIMVGIHFLVQ